MEYIRQNTIKGDYNYYDCDPYLVGVCSIDRWYENQGRGGCDIVHIFPCHSHEYGGDCFHITKKHSPAAGYISNEYNEENVSFEEGITLLCKNGCYPWEEDGGEDDEEKEEIKYVRRNIMVEGYDHHDCDPFLVGERRIALWNENESTEGCDVVHMFPCYSKEYEGDCFLIKKYEGEKCYEKIISLEDGVKLLCEKVNFYWIIDKEIEEKGEE